MSRQVISKASTMNNIPERLSQERQRENLEGSGTAYLIGAKVEMKKEQKTRKDDSNRCNYKANKLIGEPGSPCKRRVYRKE